MDNTEYKNLKEGEKIFKLTKYGIIEYEIVKKDEFDTMLGTEFEYKLSDGTKMPIIWKKSKNYFLNKQDAISEQYKRQNYEIKKKKLYKYEVKLNEELGINTFIIKI